MRAVLFKKIHERMRDNPNLFFLTADVGFNLVEPMFKEFPDRTRNVGIAEQNLIGITAGLSNVGFKVVAYSYTNFLAERAFEQIRNDICLHHYAPILVGTTTGFDNAGLGVTHHALDDIGALKVLPHIRIYSPSSAESIEVIFDEALRSSEATFIRFTKSDFSDPEHRGINRFVVRNDSDLLVITHGKMLQNAIKAAVLRPLVSIFAMDQLKPLPAETLEEIFKKYRRIVVVEDNFKSGLYNSIAEWMVENGIRDRLLHSISVEEKYHGMVGDPAYLEDLNGLSPEKIAKRIAGL